MNPFLFAVLVVAGIISLFFLLQFLSFAIGYGYRRGQIAASIHTAKGKK